jgi:RNA polymerase sigma-70 factor (ECF subfamily)
MSDYKKHTAEELMLIYQNNHPEEAFKAFEEIYYRYKSRVYSYLSSKLTSKEDCEDIMQKIFLKFHDKKHLYSAQYKCEQWLFVIARTQLLDFFRATSKDKSRHELINDHLQWQSKQSASDIDLSLINNVSVEQKEFLEMKVVDELSYEEMSKILNKSEASLRKNFSRLVQKLRKGEAL